MNFYSKKCELSTLKVWILKLKSVDSEAKKCGFVKKNSHFFYCLLPKVWFNSIVCKMFVIFQNLITFLSFGVDVHYLRNNVT